VSVRGRQEESWGEARRRGPKRRRVGEPSVFHYNKSTSNIGR